MRTIKQKVQTISRCLSPQVKDGCAERNCSHFCCGKSSKLDPDFGSVIITSILFLVIQINTPLTKERKNTNNMGEEHGLENMINEDSP
jgi:hypothetical protein